MNGYGVRVVDWFVPFDKSTLNTVDHDLGSTGITLISDGTVTGTGLSKLMVLCGKSMKLYVINRDNLGSFTAGGPDNVVDTLQLNPSVLPGGAGQTGAWQGTSFFNAAGGAYIYQVISNGPGYHIGINGVTGVMTILHTTATIFGYTTGMPAISSNGQSNAVLWSTTSPLVDGSTSSSLRVFDESFTQLNTFTTGSGIQKFTTPAVVNGRVFFGSTNGVVFAYGLPGGGGSPPVTPNNFPAPSPGAAVITITAFPAAGALTPISGTVSGLTNPAAFEAVLYVRSGDGVHWWIKPQPGTFAALDATGAFTFAGWASNPPTDVSVTAFALAIIPVGAAIIPSPRE